MKPEYTQVWEGDHTLIGHGYITRNELEGDFLMINDDYEVPLSEVEYIINFSDTKKPSSYYRVVSSRVGPYPDCGST